MEKFERLTAISAPMLGANINTDAIIPSHWLRDLNADLGDKLFSNLRYDAEGRENPHFVLNQEPYRHAQILLAGPNFGCGSSREQAVWALMRFGIRSVIAPSFSDIFYDNSFHRGLLPIRLSLEQIEAIVAAVAAAPSPEIKIDLVACTVTAPGMTPIPFEISEERRLALLEGMDDFTYLIQQLPEIAAFETQDARERPWAYQRVWSGGSLGNDPCRFGKGPFRVLHRYSMSLVCDLPPPAVEGGPSWENSNQ